MSDSAEARSLVIEAKDCELTGKRGVVYGPLSFTVTQGEIAVIVGPGGSGRSCLLLSLAGRMKPDAGSQLHVLGHELPSQRTKVQRLAAVANMTDVDTLDQASSVGAHLREHLAYNTPWYKNSPKPSAEALLPAFGDLPLPKLSSLVRDLTELDAFLLRLDLALLQKPSLLLVDDVDSLEDDKDRDQIIARLKAIAASGVTIVAAAADQSCSHKLSNHIINL
jgi:ABC-type multidrug transport system ATPase subunit